MEALINREGLQKVIKKGKLKTAVMFVSENFSRRKVIAFHNEKKLFSKIEQFANYFSKGTTFFLVFKNGSELFYKNEKSPE